MLSLLSDVLSYAYRFLEAYGWYLFGFGVFYMIFRDQILYVTANGFLEEYGWYMFGLVLFYIVFRDRINKKLDEWYEKREERNYAAKYHKNPDLARERMEGMAAARQRMQEELNRKAKEAEEKRKEKEEQKRQEKLKELEALETGHVLSRPSTSKSGLKPEYNPLMGDGNARYRPPKKSCCKKGGGCG